MAAFKTLLVAVADTPSARHASGQGIALAASAGADLVGVSVCPPYEGTMNRLHITDMRERIEGPLRSLLAEFKTMADKAGVPCRPLLVPGRTYEAIADTAEEEKADLIVLGTEKRSRLERSLLGATEERVIGFAQCPVLVIPEGANVDFSRILLATDGSKEVEKASNTAIGLAGTYGGALRAVSVVDVPDNYRLWENVMKENIGYARSCVDKVAQAGQESSLAVEATVIEGEAAETIVQTAEEGKSTLIVMGTHGRTGIKRLMMGGVAVGVLRRSTIPVLVVP